MSVDVSVDKVFVGAFCETVVDASAFNTRVFDFVLTRSEKLGLFNATTEAWLLEICSVTRVNELGRALRVS